MVLITVHEGVVGVIEWIHEPVFNQWSDAVVPEFVAEDFGLVVSVVAEAPQVVGVSSGHLRADLRVMFLRGNRVDVGDVHRFTIHESLDVQPFDALVRAVSVVATEPITVKTSRIKGDFTGAFHG